MAFGITESKMTRDNDGENVFKNTLPEIKFNLISHAESSYASPYNSMREETLCRLESFIEISSKRGIFMVFNCKFLVQNKENPYYKGNSQWKVPMISDISQWPDASKQSISQWPDASEQSISQWPDASEQSISEWPIDPTALIGRTHPAIQK